MSIAGSKSHTDHLTMATTRPLHGFRLPRSLAFCNSKFSVLSIKHLPVSILRVAIIPSIDWVAFANSSWSIGNDHVMATEGRRGNVEGLSALEPKVSGFGSKVAHSILCVDMTIYGLMAQDGVMVTLWIHDERMQVPHLSERNQTASILL
jgi:hypothetical protein